MCCWQVGLQLVGLALVAFSTTLPEASGVACVALVAWQRLPSGPRWELWTSHGHAMQLVC